MKHTAVILIIACGSSLLVFGCMNDQATVTDGERLKDGVYNAASQPDAEHYFVTGTIKIEKGKIVSLTWEIRDKNRKDRLFDETYGPEVYPSEETYRDQCRDNLSGMKTYAPRLISTQDSDQVDAVTGATWAYDKFKSVVRALLAQARE